MRFGHHLAINHDGQLRAVLPPACAPAAAHRTGLDCECEFPGHLRGDPQRLLHRRGHQAGDHPLFGHRRRDADQCRQDRSRLHLPTEHPRLPGVGAQVPCGRRAHPGEHHRAGSAAVVAVHLSRPAERDALRRVRRPERSADHQSDHEQGGSDASRLPGGRAQRLRLPGPGGKPGGLHDDVRRHRRCDRRAPGREAPPLPHPRLPRSGSQLS